MAKKARTFFKELAERYDLTVQWTDDAPVNVCCIFPKQEGLAFDLAVALDWDELTLSHDWFWADLFPADQASTWSDFERLADGMLSGEARALIYHCGNPKRYYRTEAQICEGGKWRSVSTGLAPWRWRPFGRRTETVQNHTDYIT